jgi:predicted ATPase
LGGTAGVVAQVIPELELIVGKQPAVAELGPAETQNRFSLAFQNFIRVFATSEHPLVVFLDDMQWADSATLQMLETLLGQPELRCLLFVLAYRDNETGPAHPFSQTMGKLEKGGTFVERVSLDPLGSEDLNRFVSDSLRRSPTDCASLTRLIEEKTGGNPFFASEFLKTLYREGLIWFDPSNRYWCWDENKIGKKALAENVVDLMAARLLRLKPEARSLLSLASCIGSAFDAETLALIGQKPMEQVETELDEPLSEGLILALPRTGASISPSYRFQHDRIQQAAYGMIDAAAKPATHLSIGRLILKNAKPEALDRRIFDVVNHLGLAERLIVDPAERKSAARLCFSAARKAKNSTAYSVAENYSLRALTFLGEDAWRSDFDFVFGVHRELAECQYLAGELAQAETSFAALLSRARTDLERAGIYALQIQLYQVAGDYSKAYEISVKSFEELGLAVPKTDADAGEAIEKKAAEAKERMAGKTISGLIDAPRLTDPRIGQLLRLLEASAPPVYMVRPALFAWVAITMLCLSLEYGNTEASCYAYGVYAILLAAVFDDVASAYEFSQLAIRLNEKLDDPRLKGSVLHLLGDHVNFWINPIATDLPILERGFRACVEGGDLIYSNYIAFQSIWHLWEKGEPLDQILEATNKSLAFAQQSKHRFEGSPASLRSNERSVVRRGPGHGRDRGRQLRMRRRLLPRHADGAELLGGTVRRRAPVVQRRRKEPGFGLFDADGDELLVLQGPHRGGFARDRGRGGQKSPSRHGRRRASQVRQVGIQLRGQFRR